jgi:formylglycine-generating enzyme required for sulfatase activity
MSRRWIGLGLFAALVLAGGCSGDTKPKIVEPDVAPPRKASDLYAISTSQTRISLRWRDNSDNETGFDIERRAGASGQFLRLPPADTTSATTVAANVTSFDDQGVQNGTAYTYRIVVVRFTAKADPSNEVTVLAKDQRPPDPPSNPSPADLAQGIDETAVVTLSWSGTHPAGVPLTFDVYFGRTLGTMKVKAGNISETTYTLTDETLVRNAHYFWRVVAHDDTGVSAPSPAWGFNTSVDRDTVPGGFFAMGDTLQFLDDDSTVVNPLWHPGSPVSVQTYTIDRFLVTNQQYADFLNQQRPVGRLWIHDDLVSNAGRDSLWAVLSPRDTDSDITFSVADSAFVVSEGREDFPVVQVSWFGANAYARHYGRRLPTEAEWEKAARGTSRDILGYRVFESTPDTIGLGSPFPWGRWTGLGDLNRGNFRNSGDPYENAGRVRSTPTGFYNGNVRLGYHTADGASPYGVYDMAGNVWQWTEDWFGPYQSPHRPPSVGSPAGKVIRGSSFDKPYASAVCWNRTSVGPEKTDRSIGFRTVGTPSHRRPGW